MNELKKMKLKEVHKDMERYLKFDMKQTKFVMQ